MTRVYDNYRWEPAFKRKGDRWYFKRDSYYVFSTGRQGATQEQVIATVQYDSNSTSPYWGKWHLSFGAQSPALNALRRSDVPKFSSKNDAIAWATAMVKLEGMT